MVSRMQLVERVVGDYAARRHHQSKIWQGPKARRNVNVKNMRKTASCREGQFY